MVENRPVTDVLSNDRVRAVVKRLSNPFVAGLAFNAVLLQAFANVSPVAFFRKIFPAQLLAFTTQSSAGTLPVTPTSASTTPAVMPRNQWTWKTALRNVVVINQNSTLSDSHRRRPASLVLRLLA
mgnify:CR=1 FL=1